MTQLAPGRSHEQCQASLGRRRENALPAGVATFQGNHVAIERSRRTAEPSLVSLDRLAEIAENPVNRLPRESSEYSFIRVSKSRIARYRAHNMLTIPTHFLGVLEGLQRL